jgi:hypothetical protein
MTEAQLQTVGKALYRLATMECDGDCPSSGSPLKEAALVLDELGVSWLKIAEDEAAKDGGFDPCLDSYLDYLQGEIAAARVMKIQ